MHPNLRTIYLRNVKLKRKRERKREILREKEDNAV